MKFLKLLTAAVVEVSELLSTSTRHRSRGVVAGQHPWLRNRVLESGLVLRGCAQHVTPELTVTQVGGHGGSGTWGSGHLRRISSLGTGSSTNAAWSSSTSQTPPHAACKDSVHQNPQHLGLRTFERVHTRDGDLSRVTRASSAGDHDPNTPK